MPEVTRPWNDKAEIGLRSVWLQGLQLQSSVQKTLGISYMLFCSPTPPSSEMAILYGAAAMIPHLPIAAMIPHLPRAGHCDSQWMGSLLALDLWSSEKR